MSLLSQPMARWAAFPSMVAVLLMSGCSGDGASGPAGNGRPATAFGVWSPGPNDTCPAAVHDQFAVVGPDGKTYPTWHPPTDPASGCTFGHEHGRDPRGSKLYWLVGPIPFGFANDQLDIWDPSLSRHEDHVGHKVEWENDVPMRLAEGAVSEIFEITCDILTKLHQGTHSPDAFVNNLHELAYHIRCSDGTEMHFTIMAAIGTPGEFIRSCDRDVHVQVGVAQPANSPTGGGRRIIPDRTCIEQDVLVGPGATSNFNSIRESWEISQSIRTADGRRLASINPYYQVRDPSRHHDPALPNVTGRPVDACFETEANGDTAQGDACDESTAQGTITSLPHDDPRSAFRGAQRFVDINSNRITNEDGPEIWYTDPFGKNARTEPFPGSIRQAIAQVNNDIGVLESGPVLGRNRRYYDGGTHSPN